MSLIEATASSRLHRFAIDGESFEVGPLRMTTAGRLQAFLRGLPHPERVRQTAPLCVGLDREIAMELLQAAQAEDRAWPPSVVLDPSSALRAFAEHDGTIELIVRVLQQVRPDLDEPRLVELAGKIDTATALAVISTAFNATIELTVGRASSEVLLTDREGLRRLVTAVLGSLKVEVPAEKVEAIAAVIALEPYGSVTRIVLDPSGPAVPKGRDPTAGDGAPARPSRSTSASPTRR